MQSLSNHGRISSPRCRSSHPVCGPGRRICAVTQAALRQTERTSFPQSYTEAIRLAQDATTAAIADGFKLVEVEFPSAGLDSVAGDEEGANEMTLNMRFLRQFCRAFQHSAATTRLFFPDEKEMLLAQQPSQEPQDATFADSRFQLDYLTQPNALSDMLISWGQPDVLDRAQAADELFVMAYPSFNVNEIIAIADLYEGTARATGRPIVVFNGELDRIRSGYYPRLVYRKLAKLADDFIPLFESALYIHNFKGANSGALFRVYPGPWQVLKRTRDGLQTVHTQDTMPSLKEVALNILPNA